MKNFSDFDISVPSGKSGQINTQCPRCSAQRRKKRATCLSVNIDEGVWLCHHCGWSGTLSNGSNGSSNVLHWRKPKHVKPDPIPVTELSSSVIKWFADRGVSEQTLLENNISERKVYMPQIETMSNSIAFPYYKNRELINIKYRDGKKHFRLEAGAERSLYGIDDIEGSDVNCVIVEGEIDKLSLWEAGIRSCVSVPDGAPPVNTSDYSSKFEYLNDPWLHKEVFPKISRFTIAVDNDEPGNKLENELSRRLGKDKCYRVFWPEGCKDANDVLVKHGKTVLSECIAHAKPYPIEGTFNATKLSDSINRLYTGGSEKGVTTGWENLDRYYLVRPGGFTVVTGIPNSGKSNWLDALMVNIAKNHGWNFAIFSPENQPLEDHMARVIEKYVGHPFFDGPTPRMTQEELDDGKSWITKHFTWILPDDDAEWSLDLILDRAKMLVLTKGIRGLVIDPWNELEHSRDSNQTETEYISSSLKRMRQFARKYGIHLWIVAHPAKLYRDKNGKLPVPTPYDISGSARWHDKSDNCITVWRNNDNDSCIIKIFIQKIRFRQDGTRGEVELSYNWRSGTYHLPENAVKEIPAVVQYS